jgi:hypothetical protein
MMDNLKQLAALMQVFQGLQGQNSLGDITQLAQLDQGQRESADKSRYYDQNQALEQRKFDALLAQQAAQNAMGQDELGLRRQGEARMTAGQNAEIGYRNQNMELQRQKALMMKPYYEQLIATSGVSMEQKQSQMAAIEHFMNEQNGGGDGSQPQQLQLGPGEMEFIKRLAEQFKAQPQPTR